MRKLTFDSIMDFFGKHNRTVFQRILEAQRNGTLSPFVGAGLSVSFGYKQWGGVLKELAENIMDEAKKALVLGQIQDSRYEEAAGIILEEYPFMLDQLPDIVSPDILTRCSEEKKRSSAVWALPYLFRRELVVTTNFDRCLEECYRAVQNAAIPTVTPVNRDRLAQLQLNQELCLLKLHGDIGKEAVSIDDLVFTGDQYNAHYAEGSPLVSVLTQRFSSRRMLFLGCSLSSDRTMKVLEQVVKTQNGIRHFAILGCKKSEISTKMKKLQTLGILPIFYDDSNHGAVRVILERLLEETDSVGYRQLRRSCQSMVPAAEEKRPLMFDSEYFPFSGRETELARLAEFCEAEDQLLWWAVTGPGGMGKSRLVFEFCKNMRQQGWQIQRFEANPSRGSEARRLEELPGWTPEAEKTIVVLDDVQAYMESVCTWMTRMDRHPRSEELRILLLERDGTNLSDAAWLGPDFKNSYLDEWCHGKDFLRLKSMTDDQLMAVMTDYAKAAGKTLNAELLLKTLECVDPQFKRPLYAVAIADARCQGKDPTNWNRDKVLDTLLDRELGFHLDRLQGLDGKKPGKSLRTELERLLAEACIRGFLPLEQVELKKENNPPYPYLQQRMKNAELEPEDFCKHLGILQTAVLEGRRVDQYGHPVDDLILKEEAKIILLTCPDLLKEHLVLKLAFEKKTLELLPDGWHLDPNRLLFLRRLWVNYPDRLKDQTAFWNRFFSAPTSSSLPARLYGELLWGCTFIFPTFAQQAVDILSEIYEANNTDTMIVSSYASSLCNISNTQSTKDQARTLDLLEALYDTHPDIQNVAVAYAMSLANLSTSQVPQNCISTVNRLELLHKNHPNSQEVAIAYATGLAHLSTMQSPEKQISAIEQLKFLYSSHSDCIAISEQYAKCLANYFLTLMQECPDKCPGDIIYQLEEMYLHHPHSERLAVNYASTLPLLTAYQDEEAYVWDTLQKSRSILINHPLNYPLRIFHSLIWFNLTLVQDEANIPNTVKNITDFLREHPDTIPRFKQALDKHLSEHPDHTARYQPLLELGGDGHA